MPEEVVASDPWSQIIYYDDWNSLELRWLPSTANAADSDLKTTMEVFAHEAVNRTPKTLIVDTTEFRHAWGDGMMQWRDTEKIPLYNQSSQGRFHCQPSLPAAHRRGWRVTCTRRAGQLPHRMVQDSGSGLPVARHVTQPPRHRPSGPAAN